MKTIILIIFTLFLSITSEQSKFCEGYEAGYKRGYCYEIFGCLEPIPPNCPIPEIHESTYEDGYNRGFQDGLDNQNDE